MKMAGETPVNQWNRSLLISREKISFSLSLIKTKRREENRGADLLFSGRERALFDPLLTRAHDELCLMDEKNALNMLPLWFRDHNFWYRDRVQ